VRLPKPAKPKLCLGRLDLAIPWAANCLFDLSKRSKMSFSRRLRPLIRRTDSARHHAVLPPRL
jgi:hypothetical protein